MEVLFAGTTAKELDYPDDNEDCWGLHASLGRIVVCDGATESFDGKGWACAVRDAFMQDAHVNISWLEAAIAVAANRLDVSTLSWSRQAALERGSFTTLLGVDWNIDTRELNLWCVGDSLFVLVRESQPLKTVPYTTADEFTIHPQLLSTVDAHNGFVREDAFTNNSLSQFRLDHDEEAVVLCMTDAIGAWLLSELELGLTARLEILRALRDEAALRVLVSEERSAGRMRRDDTTLVAVRLTAGERP